MVPRPDLEKLAWRNIGPPRGGRVVAVTGDPVDRAVFYFGACAGGVWKTTDAGTYWRNVSDGFLRSAAVGAIAVAPSDPNVVWVGTGEACVRNDVSHGDGVYRSTDAGRTFEPLGLEATRHIARVRVHPTDPDTAWVAALGDIFGPNPERGVFRTRDGGRSWEHVLAKSPGAGACDLWLDPGNPRVLFAAIWDAERRPWAMRSGGPDSGLWRSTDAGDSWEEISRRPGLPDGLLGRIGVCSAPLRGERVWAVIEAADGGSGLYRSEDGGDSWSRASDDRGLIGRPWYYSHIVPDPNDPETLYSMNLSFQRSSDGGRSFHVIQTPHGDNHDLWIDPNDSRRMIEGNDGGACVSLNGGESFSTIYNQPTGCFYHVDVDDRFPYRVYGTQQDNSAISVPSRSRKGYIGWGDCYPCGPSESGDIAVDPKDPNVVYSGATGSAPGGGGPIWRYDHAREQTELVTIWPEYFFGEGMAEQKHRFPWTFPIQFSPHDPRVLYACGERVFRTEDGGQSWQAISPDLTRADPEKLAASGGPITLDTSGAEVYCTISAFCESPQRPGLLFVGTDDGRVHVSRDAGASWKEVTPPELGAFATVTTIEPSPHDPDTLYLCAHRYRLQDRAPRLYRSSDAGSSWTPIVEGLDPDEFTRVIRADPARRGLLFAGTERRALVSLDDGASWQPLAAELPVVPIYDLVIHGSDLVAASHGRGFFILDDLGPLRDWPAEPDSRGLRLCPPPRVHRYPTPPGTRRPAPGVNYLLGPALEVRERADGSKQNLLLDAGQNPRDGVTVWYWLNESLDADADLELSFRDASGRLVRRFEPGGATSSGNGPETRPKQRDWEKLPTGAGLQCMSWDLRSRGVRTLPDAKGEVRQRGGFLVPPGRYTVRLRLGTRTEEQGLELAPDPRTRATPADLEAQYELLLQMRDLHDSVVEAIGRLRGLRAQLGAWTRRRDLDARLRDEAAALREALAALEPPLTQSDNVHATDRLKLPAGLDVKLLDLMAAASGWDAAPTAAVREVFAKHGQLAQGQIAELDALARGRVATLGQDILAAGLPLFDLDGPDVETEGR